MPAATIVVSGFVSNDPVQYQDKGLVKFSIPVSTGKDPNRKTDWYQVLARTDNPNYAKMLPYIQKGSCLLVVGQLSPGIFVQQATGEPKVSLTVFPYQISFEGGKNAGQQDQQGQQEQPQGQPQGGVYQQAAPMQPQQSSQPGVAQQIFNQAPQYQQRQSNINTNQPLPEPKNELPF